jgi:hypothetical protein
MQDGDKRKANRVTFSHKIDAQIVATDGSWRRACSIDDVAESGAKLTVEESVEGLNLKEFFLVLSSTGSAHRCCQMIWMNENQIGVRFVQAFPKKKGRPKSSQTKKAHLRFYEI